MLRRSVVGLAIVMLFAAADAAVAQGTKVGTLVCVRPQSQEPPLILVGIEPRIDLDCTFEQIPARGPKESYRPTALRPPLPARDIQIVTYQWDVFAGPFNGDFAYGPGVLAGGYSPAAGGEPLARGLSGKVLIGGVGNEIALAAASGLEADVIALELLNCRQLRC